MLIGTLAIAGIPPFAGFFSKDDILHGAFASGQYGVWVAGLVGAALTAFYMFRLYILTFQGAPRLTPEAEHHLHESPPSMVLPLVVLALLSMVGGFVGPPMQEHGHAFARWLAPVFAPPAHAAGAHAEAHHALARGTEIALIVISVLVAALGIGAAFLVYRSPTLATRLRERWSALHALLANKYWVDELIDAAVVRPVHAASKRLWSFWDEKVVDGFVNGLGYVFEGASAVLRLVQTGFVGTYALFITIGVVLLVMHFLRR
jgi:NADH-quinone oxidoreductase subunit L